MAESDRIDVDFASGDAHCAGWLYRPPATQQPPLVILGHGLGLVKEARLDAYAERFSAAGLASLAFDYRHFGASDGQPRQLLDIGRQLEDWASAIGFARGLPDVDADRIALWGTSFAGGHVIEAAARDGKVAAVVSQCPFTDGPSASLAMGLRSSIKATLLGLSDQAARLGRRQPVRVKLVGPPGAAALMTAPDAEPGYLGIAPPGFTNEVAARIALHIPTYRPGRSAAKVRCPILFCICEHDSVAPAGAALKAARRAPHAEVRTYPIGHFDIYVDGGFERAVADQTEFLVRHLLG